MLYLLYYEVYIIKYFKILKKLFFNNIKIIYNYDIKMY